MQQEKTAIQFKVNSATASNIFDHLNECDADFVPVLSTRVDLKAYAEKLQGKAVNFEAWLEGFLVGLIAGYANDPKLETVFITNVSVIKKMMGNGIASKLLEQLLTYAAEKGFSKVGLEVNKNNLAAIGFYERSGFTTDFEQAEILIMSKQVLK